MDLNFLLLEANWRLLLERRREGVESLPIQLPIPFNFSLLRVRACARAFVRSFFSFYLHFSLGPSNKRRRILFGQKVTSLFSLALDAPPSATERVRES